MAKKQNSVLPGFRLTLGYTLLYLSLIVLIPLAATFVKSSELSWAEFSHTVFSPQALASYRLSFGASFFAALVNAIFGLIVAWVLVRYDFLGKRIVDALVDLPFALPTAVAGITLATLYAPNGWIGAWLAPFGIKVSYTQLGIFVALTFIGLPFIVRTVQPVLDDLDSELEEAAASLGANRWQTFWRVILPHVEPGAADRLRARVRPRAGRIRLGRFHFQQHSDENADCSAAHHERTGRISLRQGDGAGRGDARRFVPAVAGHQSAAMVEQPLQRNQSGMTDAAKINAPRRLSEPPFVRRLLIAIALAFLALFLVVPLVSVFAEALRQGFGFYFHTLRDPMTLSAIKLTLIAAGISVPLNCIFGVAAAWTIAKFDFPGKNILLTLIDLPFSISPVISGMIYVLIFGAQGWFGPG